MMTTKLRLLFLSAAFLTLLGGCAADSEDDVAEDESELGAGRAGSLAFLTYNVHGMPNVVTSRDPKEDMPQISPRLNGYDLVVVQKDFVYHDELVSKLTLPHRTETPQGKGSWYSLGDGLNAFSKLPLSNVERGAWRECNGYFGSRSDCWAPKGYMKVTVALAPGVLVDVYDIHMDAGRSAKDIAARDSQVAQLAAAIAKAPPDRAIIVGGDTSMRESDEASLQTLLAGSRLKDACRTVRCAEPYRVNRVMFRESAKVRLSVQQWKVETSFVNAKGEQLSDQEPVKVRFGWRLN